MLDAGDTPEVIIAAKRAEAYLSFAQVAGYFFYFGHYYGALENLRTDIRFPG